MLDFDFFKSFHHWRKFIIILHNQSHFESLFILFFFSILFLYFPPSMNNAVMKNRGVEQVSTEDIWAVAPKLWIYTGQDNGGVWASDPDWLALLSPDCLRFENPLLGRFLYGLPQGWPLILPFHSHLYLSLSCLLPLAASSTLTFWGRLTQNSKGTVLEFWEFCSWWIMVVWSWVQIEQSCSTGLHSFRKPQYSFMWLIPTTPSLAHVFLFPPIHLFPKLLFFVSNHLLSQSESHIQQTYPTQHPAFCQRHGFGQCCHFFINFCGM